MSTDDTNIHNPDRYQAGMDFGYPEHLHLMATPETRFIPALLSTVVCPCDFEAKSPDPEAVREMFDNHNCPAPATIQWAPQWHESLARAVTNLVGWGVIGFVLYLLLSIWL